MLLRLADPDPTSGMTTPIFAGVKGPEQAGGDVVPGAEGLGVPVTPPPGDVAPLAGVVCEAPAEVPLPPTGVDPPPAYVALGVPPLEARLTLPGCEVEAFDADGLELLPDTGARPFPMAVRFEDECFEGMAIHTRRASATIVAAAASARSATEARRAQTRNSTNGLNARSLPLGYLLRRDATVR